MTVDIGTARGCIANFFYIIDVGISAGLEVCPVRTCNVRPSSRDAAVHSCSAELGKRLRIFAGKPARP